MPGIYHHLDIFFIIKYLYLPRLNTHVAVLIFGKKV